MSKPMSKIFESLAFACVLFTTLYVSLRPQEAFSASPASPPPPAAITQPSAGPQAPEPPQVEPAVPVQNAKKVVLKGLSEVGYRDARGREFVDVLEGERVFLGVHVTTPDGRPVSGARPTIKIKGTSSWSPGDLRTEQDGIMAFSVVGGKLGADRLTAKLGTASFEFVINVVRELPSDFPPLPTVKGGIAWKELMKAKVKYKKWGITSKFPKSVRSKAGKKVKISGFMIPLDPELKQKHFLLTSTPSSCFFHMPGGAAGSVEVRSKRGIAVSDGPIVVEGRFEPQASSKEDIVYRLVNARLVKTP